MKGRAIPTQHEIEKAADAYRQKHAAGHIGPLRIEYILESQGVLIVPIRGLCRHHQCKAYVCAGGRTICVDRNIFWSQPEEYRQSLAHERAHIERHPELIPPKFCGIQACREFHASLSNELRLVSEWEAKEWTGRVLVPRGQLRAVFMDSVNRFLPAFADAFGAEEGHHVFGSFLVDVVAERFGVIQQVAEGRIRRDGLWGELGKMTQTARKRGGKLG